ncbi:hypothetical protein Tco_0702207 [Tanacetum coccineum]|uniref:Uncharacterized protein n=1 Tax=Tanacetum coccineum TaxID=301880 RepID=A0ABQ4XW64_9ASTR
MASYDQPISKSALTVQSLLSISDEFKSLFHPDPPAAAVDFDDVSSYPETSLKSTARRSGWNRLLNSSC